MRLTIDTRALGERGADLDLTIGDAVVRWLRSTARSEAEEASRMRGHDPAESADAAHRARACRDVARRLDLILRSQLLLSTDPRYVEWPGR